MRSGAAARFSPEVEAARAEYQRVWRCKCKDCFCGQAAALDALIEVALASERKRIGRDLGKAAAKVGVEVLKLLLPPKKG